MGHPDGAHTHGSGGSGIGAAVAVVLAVIAVAAVAGPVLAAVAELLRVLAIAVAVTAGLAVLGLAFAVAWRVRRRRAVPGSWQARQVRRAAQPLPASERAAEAPRAYLAVPQDFASLPPEVQQAVARELARALIEGLQRGDLV